MSERAYYTDSYTIEFSARVIETGQIGQQPYVVLDHTYFYPESGGQPADAGAIAGIQVAGVTIRDGDGAILHAVGSIPRTEEIEAVVDWQRRFDHMQQHTGQHILSQAFIQVAGADTVGFHLSEDSVTIDLNSQSIDQQTIDAAEEMANAVVWQNLPVVVRWATRAEAQALPLRKIPANGDEELRLIDIMDFDLTACGGTHVSRTGEVGLIKVLKQESRNKKSRIHFCCGGRALAHYRAANKIVSQLANQLTTGMDDVGEAVTRLMEREKDARRTAAQLQAQLDELEAERLLNEADEIAGYTVIRQVLDSVSAGRLRALASRLTAKEGVVALLASSSERTQLVFTRSAAAGGAMDELLKIALGELSHGSGGGNAAFAQGAAEAASPEAIARALEATVPALVEHLRAQG